MKPPKRAYRQTAPVQAGPTEAQKELELIRKKLRHFTTEKLPDAWLKTGSPRLEAVFGCPGKGISYGKVTEVSGQYSGGKSALVMELAAIAQRDGAHVGWIDAERCWEEDWAKQRGLDTNKVVVFSPVPLMEDKTKSTVALMSAEQLFAEAEEWVLYKQNQNPQSKIFIAVDSIPALMPQVVADGGLEEHAMATNARFLTKLLNRWVAIADSYHVMLILINQIRTNPGVRFGNPEYTPGGNALKFYSSVMVRVKRARKGGYLIKEGRRIGIRGILTNRKNKTGGQEEAKVGYKLFFNKPTVFVDAQEIEGEGDE